jgi:sulfite oxidase
MEDLQTKFKPYTVMTTIACSGNRRGGLKKVFPVIQGNMWNFGSIANSTYTGVRVIDLLKELGYDLEEIKDKHLIAEGMDFDVQGNFF